jgi:hypothetical protein
MAVYSVTLSMDGEIPLHIWEYPHQNIKTEGSHGWFGHTVVWEPMNSNNFTFM